MSRAREIARLKITLEYFAPPVTRTIEVPFDLKLDRLHRVIQAAMGWTDSHLYEFTAGAAGWGIPDADFGDGPLPASKTSLREVIEDTGQRQIDYIYDFGDGWEHKIKIEDISLADPAQVYPRLVSASGRCPPEDVGGVPGYQEMLEAIADPKHEDHDWMVECHGASFDAEDPETENLAQAVARLAIKWTPKRKIN